MKLLLYGIWTLRAINYVFHDIQPLMIISGKKDKLMYLGDNTTHEIVGQGDMSIN